MYGPVRTVVWEGRSREAPPYPDCATALRVTSRSRRLQSVEDRPYPSGHRPLAGPSKIRFTAIKESIHFEGKQDLQTKVMIALFELFAEVERDLISERTKEGLAAARAKGRLLGRPKGALGKSKLDGKEEEIRILLHKQVSKASIRQDRRRLQNRPASLC